MPQDETPHSPDRSPAREPAADGTAVGDRYALVLDRWRRLYGPEQWPVSVVVGTLAEARRIGQHDGANPALLPTARFGGERVADLEVLNVRTGEREPAGVYRLWRRRDA